MEELRKEIINLIPSTTLKAEIEKRGTKFKDRDLIVLTYHYAPTIKKSFELFERLKTFVKSEKDLRLIEKIIKMRNNQIKKFATSRANFIYKVEIFFERGVNETIFVKRFDKIVDNLKAWVEYYADVMEDDAIREVVVTRKYVFDTLDEKSMEKDLEWECCHLTPDFEMSKISISEYTKLEEMLDCYHMSTRIPSFVKMYDLASYVSDGKKHYGIVTINTKYVSLDEDVALCELDQPIAINKRFFDETTVYNNETCYDFFNEHWHFRLTEIEKENLENAPKQIQENYLYIKECLEKIKY